MSVLAWLDRSHTVAKPGFNRWLVPPAALCIHLCIGQVYALSVFTKPMSQAIGVTAPAPGDWSVPALGWIFSIAILILGLAAAFGGKWVERAGPRAAMFVSALCFCGGLIVAGLGVEAHLLWLVYLGYGVLGGCGLGIAYISPVSTLIKWFPDRPGLATGTAIMGFGGGALIGAPLAVGLMKHFANASGTGVSQTMIVMGLVYFVWMFSGALIVRVPAEGWKPAGYVPPAAAAKLVTTGNVLLEQALRTPQFYLLWFVLFLNVTAGIGVLGQASLMIQEMFGVTAVAAAGFVGLLSIFNMGGRIFWASMSDFMGRKATYVVFFALGAVLYVLVPSFGKLHAIVPFVLAFLVILSMYGGGFATIPAYLRDLYGTVNVGAIHGAVLTAWSAAGVAGPVLVNYIRQYQIDRGVPKADAYSITMYLMAALLVVGLFCNLAVRAVHERHFEDAPASAA
ncbi:MAG TPA: OFA family MFS transporter [Verrucomicrobiae bacterium]|nr:OFA family MFS transporter [Verrucomicrobiae bacterium]